MDDKDSLEVDLYVMGVKIKTIKVGKNSIAGLVAQGKIKEAMQKTAEMKKEIDGIIKDKEGSSNHG